MLDIRGLVRRVAVAIAVLGTTLGSVPAGAAPRALPLRPDPPPGSPSSPMSTVAAFVAEALRLSEPELTRALEKARQSFVVVLVPGILGSGLETPSGTPIWGRGKIDPSLLALPPALIDERAESGVTPSVIATSEIETHGITKRSDVYGRAMKQIGDEVTAMGLTFVPCGYDWRRDIRAGARDVQRCLERAGAWRQDRTLVFVAHSMGGLVTWTWHDLYYRQRPATAPRLRAIVTVGSPLEGSCEMMRMMTVGYVQPNEQMIVPAFRAQVGEWFRSAKQGAGNFITEYFSQDMRRLLFTWPGALELLPPPPLKFDQSCTPTVTDPSAPPSEARPLSPFSPAFWEAGAVGAEIMQLTPVPPTFQAALAKAEDFHAFFRRDERVALTVPLFAYYSQVWLTPITLPVRDHRITGDWEVTPGDGRVRLSSATANNALARVATDLVGDPKSVHGSLMEDDAVFADFVRRRLPEIVNAHVAIRAASIVMDSPSLLKKYSGRGLAWDAVIRNLEYMAPALNGTPARHTNVTPETQRDQAVVEAFNGALVRRPPPYAVATDVKKRAGDNPARNRDAAAALANVQEGPGTSFVQTIFAQANRGLALAKALDYRGAAPVLSEVAPALSAIPDNYDRRSPSSIADLKKAVIANLGISLYESGQCKAAEPFLVQSLDNEHARQRYRSPCRDRALGVEVKYPLSAH